MDGKRRGYDRELLARGATLAWRVREPVPFCWMCDRRDGRHASEHIFPRWLLDELDAADEVFHPAHFDMLGRRISHRGPIAASAMRAGNICEDCNHGWMSGLEQAVRPILFPKGGRTLLTADAQITLARWFAKTAVVLNTSQNYRLMVPLAARHSISSGLSGDFGVYLAKARSRKDGRLTYGQSSGANGLVPDEFSSDHHREAQRVWSCALYIDKLAAVVVYAAPSGWARPMEPAVRIHPPAGPVGWRHLPRSEDFMNLTILEGTHPAFQQTWESPTGI